MAGSHELGMDAGIQGSGLDSLILSHKIAPLQEVLVARLVQLVLAIQGVLESWEPLEPGPDHVVHNADFIASEVGCSALGNLLLEHIQSLLKVGNGIGWWVLGEEDRVDGTDCRSQTLDQDPVQGLLQRVLGEKGSCAGILLVQVLGDHQRLDQCRLSWKLGQLDGWYLSQWTVVDVPLRLLAQINVHSVVGDLLGVQNQVDPLGVGTESHRVVTQDAILGDFRLGGTC